MKIRLTNEQIQTVVEYLKGRCRSLDEGLENIKVSFEQVDDTSLQTIDTLIFRCDRCERWYEVPELRGDNICYNCFAATYNLEEENEYDNEIICSDYDAATRDESGEELEE